MDPENLAKLEGSRNGPRGLKSKDSEEYAWQTLAVVRTYWEYKGLNDGYWRGILDECRELKIYEKIPVERPYGSLDVMLLDLLGITERQSWSRFAQQLAADPKVSPMPPNGRPPGGQQRRSFNNYSISTVIKGSSSSGTRAIYIVRRLKRDFPEIARDLANGKYKSARAAGIAAGFIKAESTFERAIKLIQKLSRKEKASLETWLKRQNLQA